MHCRPLAPLTALLLVTAAWSAPNASLGRPTIPADWTTQTLCSCDDESMFSTPVYGVTGVRAYAESSYAAFRFAAVGDVKVRGKALKWRVRPSPHRDNTARLCCLGDLRQPFDALSLWVKNPEGREIGFRMGMTDADGVSWSAGWVAIGAMQDWRQLFFGLSDFKGGDDGQQPVFPLRSLSLTISGLHPAADTVLYFDEIESHTAPPAAITLARVEAPETAVAGQSFPARVIVSVTEPVKTPRVLCLRLLSGDTIVAETPLRFETDMTQWRIGVTQASDAVDVPLGARLRSGAYHLVVAGDGCKVDAAAAQGVTTVQVRGPDKRTQAEVRDRRGVPTLLIDDQASPALFAGGAPAPHAHGPAAPRESYRRFGEAGVHLYSLPVTSDFSFSGTAPDVWLGPDTFEYTGLDERLATILAADPQALILPTVSLCSPPWWDERHPQELVAFDDGAKLLPAVTTGRKRTVASFASPLWRKDAAESLRRLIKHLGDGPCGDHIIGYQIGSGENDAWYSWGLMEGAFGDYSHPQQEAFRAWLQARYGTLENLRVAWGQPKSPITTAEALNVSHAILEWAQVKTPSPAERRRGEGLALLDPTTMKPLADYQLFISEQVADTIRYFAKAVKDAAGEGKLCGVSYGHIAEASAVPNGLQNGGQLALSQVLADQNIDFLTSSATEAGRVPLDRSDSSPAVTASIRAHGKLWLSDDETVDMPIGERRSPWREPELALTQGGGLRLCAGTGIEDNETLTAIRRLAEIALKADRRSAAQIAVVVDDMSAAHTLCSSPLGQGLFSDQFEELAHVGAPYDVWMLDDLLEGRAPEYKLYVFLDAFVLGGQERQKLTALLARDGKTALWIYAPGAVDEMISPSTMRELTGIALTMVTTPEPLRVTLAGSHPAYAPNVTGPLTYGIATSVAPAFTCLDPRAEVLGRLPGGRAGLVARKFNNWTSIFSAAPGVPALLLRDIARSAGVHIYSDSDDALYANRSLIGLYARTAGAKRITLPQATDVYDLVHGKVLARHVTEFTADLPAGQTLLVYTGRLEDVGLKEVQAP